MSVAAAQAVVESLLLRLLAVGLANMLRPVQECQDLAFLMHLFRNLLLLEMETQNKRWQEMHMKLNFALPRRAKYRASYNS